MCGCCSLKQFPSKQWVYDRFVLENRCLKFVFSHGEICVFCSFVVENFQVFDKICVCSVIEWSNAKWNVTNSTPLNGYFYLFVSSSLKLQKRLAASVMRCGKKKVWLDPNEINEIANTNSSKYRSISVFSYWAKALCDIWIIHKMLQFVTLLDKQTLSVKFWFLDQLLCYGISEMFYIYHWFEHWLAHKTNFLIIRVYGIIWLLPVLKRLCSYLYTKEVRNSKQFHTLKASLNQLLLQLNALTLIYFIIFLNFISWPFEYIITSTYCKYVKGRDNTAEISIAKVYLKIVAWTLALFAGSSFFSKICFGLARTLQVII